MKLAPYTKFGKTRLLPLVIWEGGKLGVGGEHYDKDLWIERGEDWYALMSPQLRNKRVRIVERKDWLHAELVEEFGDMGYRWEGR